MESPQPTGTPPPNPFQSPKTQSKDPDDAPFVVQKFALLVAFSFLLLGSLFSAISTFVAGSFFVAPLVSHAADSESFVDLILMGLVGLASLGVGAAAWRLIWTSLITPLRNSKSRRE